MRSLYLKLILPSLTVIIGSVLLATAIGWRYMEASAAATALARAHAFQYALQAQTSIAHAMIERGDRDLDAMLAIFAASPDLAAMRILSPRGVVRFSSRHGEAGRAMPTHTIQRSLSGDQLSDSFAGPQDEPRAIVHTVEPIANRPQCETCHQKAGPVIALLDVDVRFDRTRAGLTAWRSLSASLAVLQAAAIVVLIAPVVMYTVVLPMGRLKRAMARVRAGDLTVRLELTGAKGVDATAADFNSMAQRLQEGARIQEELHRDQLSRAQQLATVGELSAGLAHEIRNPLSGVKATVEVVARDIPDADSAKMLRQAGAELSRIDRVVRQLLNYARPKKPSLELVRGDACVDEALILARAQVEASSVELVERLCAGGATVMVDTEMLAQVVVNLVLNASQAAASRNGAQVEVTTAVTDGAFECRVRDNGPGVPKAQAGTIFEPFFTTKPRGTGLGLAVSRRLIELQGGRLRLENPGSPGAIFVLTLPVTSTD